MISDRKAFAKCSTSLMRSVSLLALFACLFSNIFTQSHCYMRVAHSSKGFLFHPTRYSSFARTAARFVAERQSGPRPQHCYLKSMSLFSTNAGSVESRTDVGAAVADGKQHKSYVDVHAHLIHEKFEGSEDAVALKCRDAGKNASFPSLVLARCIIHITVFIILLRDAYMSLQGCSM